VCMHGLSSAPMSYDQSRYRNTQIATFAERVKHEQQIQSATSTWLFCSLPGDWDNLTLLFASLISSVVSHQCFSVAQDPTVEPKSSGTLWCARRTTHVPTRKHFGSNARGKPAANVRPGFLVHHNTKNVNGLGLNRWRRRRTNVTNRSALVI
jgi:hypothetical protein